MPIIYHITSNADWNTALKKEMYESPSLAEEGFIHCSQKEQVDGVLKRYFSGKSGLVKLVIDTDRLKSRYVFEWSPTTQDTFPHIYGPLNLDAVLEVVPVEHVNL
jgi:uncharacterized protein (DUF952 family)